MKCKKCGHEIEDGMKTCLNCGSAVDFKPAENPEVQKALVKSLGKIKKKKKNVLVFIIGLLSIITGFVLVAAFVLAGNSVYESTYSGTADYSIDYQAMIDNQRESTTTNISEETTNSATEATTPYTLEYTTEKPNKAFPINIISTSAKASKAKLPILTLRFSNSSEDYIRTVTVRFIAYDKNGEKMFFGSSQKMGYREETFTVKLNGEGTSDPFTYTMSGFPKAKKIYYKSVSAVSLNGYTYYSNDPWKNVTVGD